MSSFGLTFFEMTVGDTTVSAEIDMHGPKLRTDRKPRTALGAIYLGPDVTIVRRDGMGIWWITGIDDDGRQDPQIPLPWCGLDEVRRIACAFGIVGVDDSVRETLRGSPAWQALIERIAADPIGAERWSRGDCHLGGWWIDAVRAYKAAYPGAPFPREERDPATVYAALRTTRERMDRTLDSWPTGQAQKRLSLVE